jgi:putative GTP pyrophosphokinase
VPPIANQISNSAADRAGTILRNYVAPAEDEGPQIEPRRLLGAYETAEAYRALHAYPLTRVTLGVRSMTRTATGGDAYRPGQRFKRMDRIIWKLLRHPHMRLSQMEDIGGCRVVLPSIEVVYAVAARITKTWNQTARATDYIAQPKQDGYRGYHIVEKRDGRFIEVQLRTVGQHEWAQAIEEYEPITGYRLKDGSGPVDLREYLRVASDRIARSEEGNPFAEDEETAFERLREQVRHYFRGRE